MEPAIQFNQKEEMLFSLAKNDLTKVEILRRAIPKKILYARYYLNEVGRVNELIEEVEQLKRLKTG